MNSEDVFKKHHYLNIIFLIDMANKYNKKITLHHLKYALVKNHNINLNNKRIKKGLDSFFLIPINSEIKSHYNMLYKIGEISKKEFESKINKNQLSKLKEYGWLKQETYFTSTQNLVNHLGRIKKMGLIRTKKQPSKGYRYYEITKNFLKEYRKFYLKFLIDRMSLEDIDKLLLDVE